MQAYYCPYILGRAIVDGNLDIVKHLIEQWHCDAKEIIYKGFSPLHFACATGHLNIVKYLVEECHCNVDIQSKNGTTAMLFALEMNHFNVVVYLVGKK